MLVPVDVHNEEHVRFLFEMLKYRDDLGFVNIEGFARGTAGQTPTYEQHQHYLQTTTRYKCHFIWVENGGMLASAYLTHENELGLFVVPGLVHQGIGRGILQQFREMYPDEPITAHVHVENVNCNVGCIRCGFKHVANFYVLEPLNTQVPDGQTAKEPA